MIMTPVARVWAGVAAAALCASSAWAQGPLTDAEQAWLRAHAHPISSAAAEPAFDDLAAFGQIVGDARVVGLGEGTHGTHEFFAIKARLFRYLVREKGFTVFAIEANQPEAERVNAYIQGEPGDARELIAGMGFWIWNTEEVLHLVEWMRDHNAQSRQSGAGPLLTFAGVDMQTPDLAMREVKAFVAEFADAPESDPAHALAEALTIYDQPRPGAAQATAAGSVSRVPGPTLAGKRVRLSAWIRTRGAGEARLWMRAINDRGMPVAFEAMAGRGVQSREAFIRHEITLDIPADAALAMFGGQFTGEGEAWFDSMELFADDRPVLFTDCDLTFDGAALTGVWPALEGSDLAIDGAVLHEGAGSLRVRGPATAAAPSRQVWVRSTGDVVKALERARAGLEARAGADRTDRAIQAARLVHQWAQLTPRSTTHRDKCMAENTMWVLGRHAGERMVLWAHNFHVTQIPGKQGGYLQRDLGAAYLSVGFSTSEGTYSAIGEGQMLRTGNVLQSPPMGSFESIFDALGEGPVLVDLRPAATGDSGAAWLAQTRMFGGTVGAVAMPQRFLPLAISPGFDVMIHVPRTTASRLLTPAPE